MSRRGCLLLILLASTQASQAQAEAHSPHHLSLDDSGAQATPTSTPIMIPTVTIPQTAPVSVPTVTIPQPTPTPTPTRVPRHRAKRHTVSRHHAAPQPTATPKPQPARPQEVWIWAYLTSYCPGAAGWVSSSGMTVFYGMLANDYYPFGTRVYLPVLGITGLVEDRVGAYVMWNHFDVWSPVCYSTPTGWFRVAVQMSH